MLPKKTTLSFLVLTSTILCFVLPVSASQAEINRVLGRAREHTERGEHEKALGVVRDGLRAYPRAWELFLKGGKIRAATGNSAMAISNFELALRHSPGNKEIIRLLAEEYRKMGNRQKAAEYEKMFLQQAPQATAPQATAPQVAPQVATQTATQTATQAQPRNRATNNFPNLKALLSTLDSLVTAGQFDTALTIISNNLERFKRDPGLFYYAGVIRFERKEYDKAITNFNRALRDRSLYFRAYYYLGMIYERQNNNDKALANYRLFLQYPIGDNLREEITSRVEALSRNQANVANQQLRAMGHTQAYIPLDSIFGIEISDTTKESGKRAFSVATQHIAANRFDELAAELTKISVEAKDEALEEDVLWANANVFMFLNLNQQAERNLVLLGSKFPNSTRRDRYGYHHGRVLKLLGNYNEAIEKFQAVAAMRNSPFATSALINQAEIHELNSDYTRAVNVYSSLLEMLTRGAIADAAITPERLNFRIANALTKDFKTARAKNHLLKIIGTQNFANPYTKKAILLLADSEYKNGNSAEALRYYELYFNNYTAIDRNNPNNTWVIFQIGNSHRNLNNFDKAVETYRSLIANYPAEDRWVQSAKWKLDDTIWQARFRENFRPNQTN